MNLDDFFLENIAIRIVPKITNTNWRQEIERGHYYNATSNIQFVDKFQIVIVGY